MLYILGQVLAFFAILAAVFAINEVICLDLRYWDCDRNSPPSRWMPWRNWRPRPKRR